MFGIILMLVASIFRESATSIGKYKTARHEESIYTFGFLNLFWAAILFLAFALFVRGEFILAMTTLPTLALRIVLEIAQAHVGLKAITVADRSTFGFLRVWTLPLLLVVDIFVGYTVGIYQMLGISLIVLAFLFLFVNHGIRKKGAGLVLFTALNAVLTVSLFKYHLTLGNSVETEQIIVMLVLMLYFYLMARHVAHEKPMYFFKKPIFFFQSFAMGIAHILASFAIFFAPPSVIMAVKRGSTILWAIISGNMVFHEKKLAVKIAAFILIAGGIALMAFG